MNRRKRLLEIDEQEYLARRNEAEISGVTIASAVAALQDHSSEDLFKTRAEVAQKISALVEHVHVFGGGPLSTDKNIQEKKAIMIKMGFAPEQVGTRFENPKAADYKKHRCFVVMFRDEFQANGSTPSEQPKFIHFTTFIERGFLVGRLPVGRLPATELAFIKKVPPRRCIRKTGVIKTPNLKRAVSSVFMS